MMRQNLAILVIMCASLILRADSCLVTQQDVHQSLPALVPAEFESKGFTENTDTDIGDVGEDIVTLLDTGDVGELQSGHVGQVFWEVTENLGHLAARSGTIEIQGQEMDPAKAPWFTLLTFQDITNNQGEKGNTKDDADKAELIASGQDFVENRVNGWIDAHNDPTQSPNDDDLKFRYRATWQSNPQPTAGSPDDFKWTVSLLVVFDTVISLDIPGSAK